MARRKLKEVKFGACRVTIHRDSEWDEFLVRAAINGRVVGGKQIGRAHV